MAVLDAAEGMRYLNAEIGNADSRSAAIQVVLQALVATGFERALYFDIAKVPASSARLLILSCALPDSHAGALVGHVEEWTDFSREDPSFSGSIKPHDAAQLGTDGEEWVRLHGLIERVWVDIPIERGTESVGLLRAQWMGLSSDLEREDREVLRLMGHVLAARLAARPIVSPVTSWIAPTGDQSPTDFVGMATARIGEIVGAAVAAVFEYEWPTNTLVRIAEYAAPGIVMPTPEEDESYEVGVGLTGSAWLDSEVHYVADFQRLIIHAPDLIDLHSLGRHEQVLGRVRTAMFAIIGRSEPRFLLRFTNRADQPELPFLEQRDILSDLAADLSAELDALVARTRLHSLEQVAGKAVSDPGKPTRVVDAIARKLGEERINTFAIACHVEGGQRFSLRYAAGKAFTAWRRTKIDTWQDDELYRRVLEEAESKQGARTRFTALEANTLGPTADALRTAGAGGVLSFSIQTGNVRGALLIPLPRNITGRRQSAVVDTLRGRVPDTLLLLQAFAEIAGNAISARSSHLTAEGARRVLGYIGHELGTPLTRLGDIGVTAVATAQLALRDSPTLEARQKYYQLERLYDDIEDTRRHVAQSLALAPLVAQESRGRLQLHFRSARLSETLGRAREQALQEARTLRWKREPRHIEVVLTKSALRLPEVVADHDLLTQVFVNLMRNGLKYSLPGQAGAIDVIVQGQPQPGLVIVQVENYGFGIRSDRMEDIFEPFVRGELEDEVKAIRGMGLGLFLSRRIMAAHSGDVFCRASVPVLHDPKKLMNMEGFETTFEVRIPRSLREGTLTYDLDQSSVTGEL
ncbi:MAG TPA: HAMP domain-containing sensor histidine kinase [Mycobacteriales bacterium]|jgi:signal transduction histidine kinase|nr:HAMP domain-containing sensor histidine kinase [Mycobacteriales bacterium]